MMHSVNDDSLDDSDDDNEDLISVAFHDFEIEEWILIWVICFDDSFDDDLGDERQKFVNEKI